MKKVKFLKLHWTKILSLGFFVLLLGAYAYTFAIPPATKYTPGETLDPICGPLDPNCSVDLNANSMVYPSNGIALSDGSAWLPSITDNSSNWNTAYSWGNHATSGYVTGTPWTTQGYITDGNTGWDNSYGFITSYTETDPIFLSSTAHSITGTDVSNWNGKQASLISGTNIKTINSTSLLGSGDIAINPSQWTTTGSDISYNTGKVGIGTTNPLYKLSVSGSTVSDVVSSDMGFNINQVLDPATISAVAQSGSGLEIGDYWYAVTYYTATGETHSTYISSAVTTTSGNQQVQITIPVSSDPRVVGRKIYRTKVGDYEYLDYYLATITNNTSTTYIDNTPDISLAGLPGASYFRTNTTSQGITINGVKSFILDEKMVSIGNGAGSSITTGGRNTLIGAFSGGFVTTGFDNTILGYGINAINSGSNNTFVGSYAGSHTTQGGHNSAFGYTALANLNGISGTGFNTAMGSFAGLSITGNANTNVFIGSHSGYNVLQKVDVSNSIAIGYQAYTNANNQIVLGNSSISQTVLNGKVGIGLGMLTPATALLHLSAGSATAGTAPLKFTSGTLLGTTEAGAVEYDGSHLYFTATNGGTRYQLDQQGGGGLASDADFNTKGGTGAGLNLVAGAQQNTFLGYEAGRSSPTLSTDTADNNTAIGFQSFYSNTTGNYNSTLGHSSLRSNTTGRYNSALGVSSLQLNSTGSYNIAIGNNALGFNTSASYNTALGNLSLSANRTGSNGVAIGAESQYYANSTTTPWTNMNTSLGYQSLRGSTTAASNTGNSNTAIGYQSLMLNSSGEYNTAIGYQSLMANTTGRINTSIGYKSLMSNTTGFTNSAMGEESLAYNTTGFENAAFGATALGANTTGKGNTANGYSALFSNTTGGDNTAIGSLSLGWNDSGSSNTAIGYGAGSAASLFEFNTNPSNSIYLGYGTKAGSFGGNTNEIVVGYNAEGRGSNTAQWGNTSITNHYLSGNIQFSTYGAGTLTTDASGNITASSDERLKDIEGDFDNGGNALDIINSINPILYKWNDTSGFDQTTTYAGFSAQNIQEVIPEAIGIDKNGYLTLSDRPILATTVNAIQELDLRVKELDENIKAVTLSDMASEFFGGIITNIEDGIAYFTNVVVETLKVGSTEKRTGITLYDEITGDPYCLSIAGGSQKIVQGECQIFEEEETEQVNEDNDPAEEIVNEEESVDESSQEDAIDNPPTETTTTTTTDTETETVVGDESLSDTDASSNPIDSGEVDTEGTQEGGVVDEPSNLPN